MNSATRAQAPKARGDEKSDPIESDLISAFDGKRGFNFPHGRTYSMRFIWGVGVQT